MAQPTLIEVGARLHDLLRRAHRGDDDRLNVPILEVGLRFLERFDVNLVRVKSGDLNRKVIRDHDYGDAIVIGSLKEKRCLMTTDKRLWLWCRNEKLRACHFADGELNEG